MDNWPLFLLLVIAFQSELRYLLHTSWTRFRYLGDTGSGTWATPVPVPTLRMVEVRLLEDRVEFWLDGEGIRAHKATHEPAKEHDAFATPGGRPRKAKAG